MVGQQRERGAILEVRLRKGYGLLSLTATSMVLAVPFSWGNMQISLG
jgi:hypothetical protein